MYKLNGIDLNHHGLILRCLYNFGSRVPTYLIINDQELSFFLNEDDACRPHIYLSTSVKYSSGLGNNMKSANCSYHPSFSYNLRQQYPLPYYLEPPFVEEYFPSHDDFYGHVSSLTPLTNNVIPINLADDSFCIDPYNFEQEGPSSSRYGSGHGNFGVQGGLGEEDYGEENVGEDDNDGNYEFDEHYISPEDGHGDDIEECDVEVEEHVDQGFVSDEVMFVDTSSAQSRMCLPVMPIVATD